MITNNVMMIKKDDAKRYQTSKILKAKNCCAKRDRSRKIAQTEIEDSKISSLNRLPEAILSLKSGKVAGVVVEKPVGEAYLKQNSELTFSKIKFNEEKKQTCIAVPKNSPVLLDKLNQTIDNVKEKI